MPNDRLEFRPGSVVPTEGDGWTFTLRDQYERIWNAYDSISRDYKYEKATDAKAAMRKFCGVTVDA